MIKIQPQYLTLSKLLDKRLFRIPEYQRAYSWTKSQRNDLFDDIKKAHAHGNEGGHFMAAIVCLRKETRTLGTDEYQTSDVVDGQQRLTTLVLILKILELELDESVGAEAKTKREVAELLVKPEGGDLLLLQTNHDSSHYYADFLRKNLVVSPDEASTRADREILSAIQDCGNFVVQWKQSGKAILDLASLLKNRLYFLLHEIEDERAVYTVFEVLNSRGLEVSWLDRLKSILMGLAFEMPGADNAQLIHELHVLWKDIYQVTGLRQGLSTESLRFAATLYKQSEPSKPLGEADAVSELRRASNAKELRETATKLLNVTKALDTVMSNLRTEGVSRISQARLLAVALHLRTDLTQAESVTVLEAWENISFRIYGMIRKDSRTRVGEFVRLAWRVVNKGLSVTDIVDGLEGIGSGFSIQDAVDNLRTEDCYGGWEENLRYFMFRREEFLAKQAGQKFSNEQWNKIWLVSPSESIEHVGAQSSYPESHKHRLGNLVLLPPRLNSQLQALSPDAKVAEYRKTGLAVASEVADLIEAGKWDEAAIDGRTNALLDWARDNWD